MSTRARPQALMGVDWSSRLNGQRFMTFQLATSAAFNRRLADIIFAREAELIDTLEHTPVAGIIGRTTSTWKRHNVLTWPFAECAALKRYIAAATRTYVRHYRLRTIPEYVQCWCNVIRPGDRFGIHSHTDGLGIAGTYYPQDMSATSSGRTYYLIPGVRRRLTVTHISGMLNLFQGDLRHFVSKHEGPGPRLSIAFDIVRAPEEGHSYVALFSKAREAVNA